VQLTKEQKLIELIKEMAGDEFIGDDCACLPNGTLISSDMLVEGNHFLLRKTTALNDLGWKSMAVNLSDIAAMAGVPRFATASLGLPKHFSEEQFRLLYGALTLCAEQYGTKIVGGDLTSSEHLIISVTVLGETSAYGPIYRHSAKPDDVVIVTGDFGASGAGLLLLLNEQTRTRDGAGSYCLLRHCRPVPRIQEALALGEVSRGRGALMDASDGLADALIQIAKRSSVAIEIDEAAIPIHTDTSKVAASLSKSARDLALYGGEDYELVATVDASVDASDFERLKKNSSAFSAIGRVLAGNGVTCRTMEGVLHLSPDRTYQHW
jgi:thiamine-monophosphate kinase